ncbi:hypothetical protein UPYG_G00049330 [Umbra pygmaea]|uniref:C2H2-type domain-containing protein n=1 Tax=Umbra pygmaea TaxID=75934 RepID=A0ABD0XTM8_UMBPY
MSTLQTLRVFLNDRLTAAALEIFGAVEKTVVEYQKENDLLRKQLLTTPENQPCRKDSLQFSVFEEEVPPEQKRCEQEWSPSLGQEDPEPTQIKEEPEELWTRKEEEQLQGLEEDIMQFRVTPHCVKGDVDQEDLFQSVTFTQTQNVENRQVEYKAVDLQQFVPEAHLNGLNVPCDPPSASQNTDSTHSSAPTEGPVGLCHAPWYPSPPIGEHHSQLSTTFFKTHCCRDCGETFGLRAELQRHETVARLGVSECSFCRQQYNSTCKLKAHIQTCHTEKLSACPFCGKTFKCQGVLSRHMRIHTGEKPFSCGDCGKSFKYIHMLKQHKLTHTGEKPYSCTFCGKSFNRKEVLTTHIRTHTGEKPYSCGDCGKSFNRKEILTTHIRTHTGEKPFSCGDCGHSFNVKRNLTAHKLTHTGEKPHGCLFCGKTFIRKDQLLRHVNNCHNERLQGKI